ncbi:hypothetical protein PHMEG_00030847, partial [Phytophthora megakarya]
MRKLRTLTQAAKLRYSDFFCYLDKTPLMSVVRQDTRWASTFVMLKRYFRLREFLSADDEELADLLPSRMTHRKLEGMMSELRCVESVSKMLQSDGLTLLDARDLFDGLLEAGHQWPTILDLTGKQELLDANELTALEPLFQRDVPSSESAESSSEEEGFAEHIFNRRRISSELLTYKLFHCIPPTSNAVERLFSVACAVLRLERHRLSPMTLEMILFLKINSDYWNVATVDSCV